MGFLLMNPRTEQTLLSSSAAWGHSERLRTAMHLYLLSDEGVLRVFKKSVFLARLSL